LISSDLPAYRKRYAGPGERAVVIALRGFATCTIFLSLCGGVCAGVETPVYRAPALGQLRSPTYSLITDD
jgi:hypothetical protein